MAKVTYESAGDVYDRSGRSWAVDAALPWLMASATEVVTRVVRRVEAQRRAQVGARATRPVDAVPEWLEGGVRQGRALAERIVAEGNGSSPLHVALRLIASAPDELLGWIGPDAPLPDVVRALARPSSASDAARVVTSEPRAKPSERVFYETLRGVYASDGRGEPTARDVTLLAGATRLDPFVGLDAARKRWEDRLRRWAREEQP